MKKIFTLFLICSLLSFKCFSQISVILSGYPLDATGWNIGGYAAVVDSGVRLTTAGTNENGYVYYDSAINLTACAQFTVKYDYKIDVTAGVGIGVADGIAFFYISTPPSGFITGGGLGLPTPMTGMVFTLDTYDNDGDALNPESQIYGYTAASTYSEANRSEMIGPINPHLGFVDDNTWHHVEIDYNAGNINIYYDYSTVPGMTGYYLITIPSGYFGFSSSTGGGYSIQSVKNLSIYAVGLATPPTVVSPVTYCQGATADTLHATGDPGNPIRWFTTDTATVVSLPGSPTPNTSVPGTYTYYVRQGNNPCMSFPDSIKVIVNPLPLAPVITGVNTYCTGETALPFTVTGATGSTILWYTSGTGGVGTTTTPIANTAVAGTTTYWGSQTVLGCEGPRDSITVTVRTTPPLPVISGTSVYCQYVSYVPPTATGASVLWYTTATGGTGSATVPTINTSIAGTYTLYATQSDSGCTSARAPFVITVNPKPVPPTIVDAPDHYCPGQAFVPFTIVSGTSVLWYTAATGGAGSGTSPTINTSTTGTYTVWATQTLLGCESDRVATVVTVYPSVTSGFNLAIKYGCGTDTVELSNTSTGTTIYTWDYGDGNSSNLTNPEHIYTVQGVYTITLTSSSGPCSDTSIRVANLLHPLQASFSVDTNLICQGKSVSFTDASTGTSITNFWNFGDGSIATGANPTHVFLNTGVYQVYEVITDFVPCHDTMYKTVYVDTISGIDFAITDTVMCQGTYVTYSGFYSATGSAGNIWNFGDGSTITNTNPVVHGFNAAGIYTVTLTAQYRACPDTTISKVVTVLPQPYVNIGADTSICKGSTSVILGDMLNLNNPLASWKWSTGQTGSSIAVTEPGYYYTTVSINNCTASDTIWVQDGCYMAVPNVFTPNGDGVNDYFFPRQLLSRGLTAFTMNIYNRWGELIFTTTTTDGRGWDGRFNNAVQPEGVFVYVIDATFIDGQKEHHQGNVTLLR